MNKQEFIKSKDTQNIFNESSYEDFINNIDYKDFCDYLKENQGQTLKKINEKYNTEERYIKCLLNIWTEKWTSFFQQGGRVVNKNGKYYVLSQKNKDYRLINPIINIIH